MEVKSLGDAVERAAAWEAHRGYHFVKDDKFTERFISFTELESLSAQLGGALQDLGLVKGDRVALILPDNDVFVLTFLAALRAGIIPVPIYPPTGLGQLAGYLDNTTHIVDRSGSRVLVTTTTIKQLLGSVHSACPALEKVVTVGALSESNHPLQPAAVQGDDTAFLQFTSGSTSKPKGVVLTHANLLANIHNIMDLGLHAVGGRDIGVTWLPLFHDMGLIGFVLAPIVHGVAVTFMPPLMFLKRPAVWLQAMSRYKGSITFAPNFAYALCVKRIRERDIEGLDLSSWRVAGCGAEPIRPETLEAFSDAYAKVGFRKEAMLPAYGLAESTLAVSFSNGVPTDRVKATVLWTEGRAVTCDETEQDSLRIVSCGKPFDHHQVDAFDLDDEGSEHPLPERTVGELRLRGASVAPGYFEEPEITARSFRDGWFHTGDLGYIADGEVYICGRSKEVVIVHGKNFYPQDIEWEASQIKGVRKGNVIAFGTGRVARAPNGQDKASPTGPASERECVVVAFETAVADPDERRRMVTDIRARVQEFIGLTLDDIVVLAAGALPKTSSGKLQRTKTRELYENGELAIRRSVREVDRVDQVKQIAKSQLEYLKLAVFRGRGKT